MNEKEIARKIINEETGLKGFKVLDIILFGSRTRGDYKEDSDWDFLIIVNKDISFSEVKEITGRIQSRLSEYYIPNDIIIRGIEQFNNSKRTVGCISFYAEREGIRI
jgi:predicted nucleotidyltransferase